MIKINDFKQINQYIVKHNIDKIFSEDIRPFVELLLFVKNEYICKEEEPVHYLLFFVEGKAKVYTTQSNGRTLLICFYEDFRILGDVELMNFQTASASVQVIEDAYCIGISLEKVRAYLMNDPKFLRFICNSLGEKLKQSTRNSSINLLYPLKNRLATYMLATLQKIDEKENTLMLFNENLTQTSELLGTSYRHLLRTLNALCLKNIIKKEENYFEVIDEKELKKLAVDVYE